MKKLIVAAFAITMTATSGYASTNLYANTVAVTGAEDEAAEDKKEAVAKDALPQAIQTQLGTDTYKDWTFADAWHVTGKQEHYVVNLKKGEETTAVKFDKEGKKI